MLTEHELPPETQKWKYCILTITLDRKKKETSNIVYLDVDIDKVRNEEINSKNPLQVIAELGEIGWEMVGIPNSSTFIFKCPMN
jgi:hypothetical protein